MAHLLIFELPGGNDTDLLEAAFEAGHAVTFLTSDLSLYSDQPAVKDWIDRSQECLEVKQLEWGQLQKVVQELHQRRPVDAVLCLIDIRLVLAARLAEMLGTLYVNVASARLLRDKFSVRVRLQQAGLLQPPFKLATTTHELKEAVSALGLPVLIKPSDGYGSQNIVTLKTPDDLNPLFSPLEIMLPSRADYGLGVAANDRLLVERYMTGQMVGCDVFTSKGQHEFLGVNEKLMYPPPSFAIRGGCFTPYDAKNPMHECLKDYVFAALDAVNFNHGATHIEVMLTEQGPQLVEINPRIVGAKIGRLVSFALGRSIYKDLIDLHLGLWGMNKSITSGSVDSSPTPLFAVTRWVVAKTRGRIGSIDLPARQDPNIRSVEILKKVDDWVGPPFENADRIGYVMTVGPSKAIAEELAERFVTDTAVALETLSPEENRW